MLLIFSWEVLAHVETISPQISDIKLAGIASAEWVEQIICTDRGCFSPFCCFYGHFGNGDKCPWTVWLFLKSVEALDWKADIVRYSAFGWLGILYAALRAESPIWLRPIETRVVADKSAIPNPSRINILAIAFGRQISA